MKIKVKYLLAIALIIIFVVISFMVINIKNKQNIMIENLNEYKMKYDKIGFNSYEDTKDLIMQVAIKDGDWSNLLLTDNFKSKYNEKDGVLGKIKFDRIEYKPYNEGKYPFEERTYIVITQGLKKTVYTFNLIGKNGYLDDIKIFEIFNLTDENGQELKAIVTINMSNFYRMFYMLSRGGDDEKAVAVTDNFHKKYPYFLDIFEHYSPLTFNHIEFIPNKSSWEKKEAYFIVDSKLECKKREYLVKFTLDKNGYLDDAKANKINEIEYEVEPLGWDYWRDHISPILVLVYKNSNYNLIKSTDNFKKKYNNKNKIFKNILVNDYKQYDKLLCLLLDDGKKYYYVDALLLTDKATLDDIVIKELPYENLTFEEAKKMYLNDFGG